MPRHRGAPGIAEVHFSIDARRIERSGPHDSTAHML